MCLFAVPSINKKMGKKIFNIQVEKSSLKALLMEYDFLSDTILKILQLID